MTDNPEALEARLLAVVPYQGKSQVAFLCHEAAEALCSLRAQLAEMEAALGLALHQMERALADPESLKSRISVINVFAEAISTVRQALASKEGGRG